MFSNIQEVIQANRSHDYHFFSPATMKLFNSKIETELLGGKYFVTSERMFEAESKEYTVRQVVDANGAIATVGEFGQYKSLSRARAAIVFLIAREKENATM